MVVAYQAVTGLDLSFTKCIIPGGLLHPHNLLTSMSCWMGEIQFEGYVQPFPLGSTPGLVKVVLEAVIYVVPVENHI